MPMLLALQGLLPAGIGSGQDRKQSASDLIGFLTYQSGRSDTHGLTKGVFNCGAANVEAREDRPAAEALVTIGTSAIPDIEAAFDSIEAHGQQSAFAFNSVWLLRAYARIRGPAAYLRLRRMLDNPRLAFLQLGIDNALAISLGITSYVSDSRMLADMAACSGVFEPKDLLDQLIAAWEEDDRHWVEASLGADARDALRSLLQGTSWAGMRAEFWRGKPSVGVAVGYRFVTPGWWSSSDEPSEINLTERTPANPEILTQFTNSTGRGCGSYRVRFFRTEEFYTRYLVGSPDLAGLLRVIADCAIGRDGRN
jgi:hypothetical protein